MIIKFDHISFSGCKDKENEILDFFKDYAISFQERELCNIDAKQQFFTEYHSKHDLIMLEHESRIPIEVTLYDSCTYRNPIIDIKEEIIIIKSTSKEKTASFLKNIGFKEKNGRFYLKPVMDNKDVIVEVIEEAGELNSKLDNVGYSSMAFWVNNINKEHKKIMDMGYTVTEIEMLTVHEKCLKIFFVAGPCNEIIEFIGVGSVNSENN